MDQTAQTFTPGTAVRLYDDNGEDNPVTWGTVVEPTTEELAALDPPGGELDPEQETFVQWSPTYRRVEYVEDLRAR
jgi:hypothetical protein